MKKENKFVVMSDENRKDFLDEHFVYEVDMLCHAFNRDIKFIKKKDNVGHNMAFECFCLHTRNLLEFFYTKKNNYASAQDFVSQTIVKKNELFNVYYDRISKMLHFRYDRKSSSGEREGVETRRIILELFKTTRTFIEHLPEKYKGKQTIKLHKSISILLGNQK